MYKYKLAQDLSSFAHMNLKTKLISCLFSIYMYHDQDKSYLLGVRCIFQWNALVLQIENRGAVRRHNIALITISAYRDVTFLQA